MNEPLPKTDALEVWVCFAIFTSPAWLFLLYLAYRIARAHI